MTGRSSGRPVLQLTIIGMTVIKKILTILCTMSLGAALFCSCKKDTDRNGNSRHDSEESVTNYALIGTWDIYRFEAVNKGGSVSKNVTDPSVINAASWRISFNEELEMTVCSGTEANEDKMSYRFYASDNTVRFGTYGSLQILSLDENSLIFCSEYFAPEESWYDDAGISEIRVYCTKSAN